MKQILKIWLALVLALCAGTTAWAGIDYDYDLTTGALSNCSVSFKVGNDDRTKADAGDEVTIIVSPDPGYATGTVTVRGFMDTGQMRAVRRAPALIDRIVVTGSKEDPNVFTITMPAANIVVDVTTTKVLTDAMVSDISAQTYTGSAITPTITVMDGTTELEEGEDYTLSYSNNINAALSSATENAPTVTITGIGDYSGTVTKTFTINKAAATISYATTELIKAFGDDAFTNALSHTPAAGTNGTGLGTVTYAVSAETPDTGVEHVATVNENGQVTITGTGTATIAATVTDGVNYTYSGMTGYNAGSASVSYTLTVEKGTITASATGYNSSFDNTAHGISVSVTKPASGYEVMYGTTEGSYTQNSSFTYTNIGNYTVYYKVTAPNYNDKTGSATVNITPATLTAAMLTVGAESLVYDGTEKRPAVTVKHGDATLTLGTNYTVAYSNNINAGTTATVTVTGKGNYTGSASKTFTINPKSMTSEDISIDDIDARTYKGSEHTPDVVVMDGNTELVKDTDYTVAYSDNINAGTATVTVTGQGNYGGTTSKDFTINQKSLDNAIIQSISAQFYTGSAIEPTITVKDGEMTLVKGTDYTVAYSNNIDAGTAATVTVTGTGNYKGTVSKMFTINRIFLNDGMIQAIDDQTYNGSAIEPTITVKDGSRTLESGTDYIVSYSNNTNAGTATVTVTGVENYTGIVFVNFTINPKTTTEENITTEEGGDETALTIIDRGTQKGIVVEEDLEVTTLNYYRTLNANEAQAYTICLPYAPPADANLKYYTLSGADGTTLHFDEINGAPQANTPYLVIVSATTDISKEEYKENITMKKTVTNRSTAGSYVMKGTLSGINHDDAVGLYILQAGNQWAKVGSNTKAYIPPFRAYIEVTSNVPERLESTFDEGTVTEITSVCTTDNDGTEQWFDLSGHPIEKPTQSGIYIHNGRKEYVK